MAIPIKAIPTLYGCEAVRMRRKIEDAEARFESRPARDVTKSPKYQAMKQFLAKTIVL